MDLINCEVILILTWLLSCIISNSAGARRFAITGTEPYVPVVTFSAHGNAKLLQQLEYGFKEKLSGE